MENENLILQSKLEIAQKKIEELTKLVQAAFIEGTYDGWETGDTNLSWEQSEVKEQLDKLLK